MDIPKSWIEIEISRFLIEFIGTTFCDEILRISPEMAAPENRFDFDLLFSRYSTWKFVTKNFMMDKYQYCIDVSEKYIEGKDRYIIYDKLRTRNLRRLTEIFEDQVKDGIRNIFFSNISRFFIYFESENSKLIELIEKYSRIKSNIIEGWNSVSRKSKFAEPEINDIHKFSEDFEDPLYLEGGIPLVRGSGYVINKSFSNSVKL